MLQVEWVIEQILEKGARFMLDQAIVGKIRPFGIKRVMDELMLMQMVDGMQHDLADVIRDNEDFEPVRLVLFIC